MVNIPSKEISRAGAIGSSFVAGPSFTVALNRTANHVTPGARLG
jgi:hypothetical protein